MFPFLTLRAVPVGLNQCPVTCFSHQHSASLKFNKLCIKVGEIIPAEHFDIEVFQVQSVRILQISTSALRFEKDVHFVGGPGGERKKSFFFCSNATQKCSEILHLSVFDNFKFRPMRTESIKTLTLIDRSCHVDTGPPSAAFQILY